MTWRRSSVVAPLLIFFSLYGCTTNDFKVEPSSIGVITRAEGLPQVVRNNRTYLLAPQARIYAADIIRTDVDSRLTIRMRDATRLSLGPESHLVLHTYDYAPDMKSPVAQMSLTDGSIRCRLAAFIEARKPRFGIRTPLASINLESDDVWSGLSDDANTLEVLLLRGETTTVTNEHGTVAITTPGHGTRVIGGSAPRPPRAWSTAERQSSLAGTAPSP